MKNRSVSVLSPGSARVSRAGDGVLPSRTFLEILRSKVRPLGKIVLARRQDQHARRVRYPVCWIACLLLGPLFANAADTARSITANGDAEAEPIVISATRTDIPRDQSPASITVIDSQEIQIRQIERVSDALREVPGLNVVQTGTAGQLTSVFTRGLNSAHTQVLLDGVPINQGLAGQFDFANLTTDNIGRIEIARGPQSTIYGPRAMAGVIQLFTKQGDGTPGVLLSAEGGSYDTFRETLESDGKLGDFDYSIGASRADTDNVRDNNQYRNTAVLTSVGWSPEQYFRLGTLFAYSRSDAGNPNVIFDPRPYDNLLTEKWLIAPHVDVHIEDWWNHRFIFSYDEERQINNPNQDGFVGPTNALFTHRTMDYQNDIHPASWLTLTSGFFFSEVDAGQKRPAVLFGSTFISDHTKQTGEFLQATLVPVRNAVFVAGGRHDWFNQFGDIWTYRFAGSYKIDETNTTLHSSVATGFSPPSSQDKIFGNNFGLEPEEAFGWDAGIEQRFLENRVMVGATYFHNDLSNLVGFNGLFDTLNLGAARTQGVEAEFHAEPIADLTLTVTYTYLDTEKTSSEDIAQLEGARLPRRPRNEVYVSASYLWGKKLRTSIESKWVNAREEINFGMPNFDVEDYTIVNFAAEYEINQHLSIFGHINNLTNEHYSEVYDARRPGIGAFPALGRAVYAGMKIRF